MKAILLLVHDDEGQEARLQAALDVTRAVNGHLICLDVMVPIVAPAYYPFGSEPAVRLERDFSERERANRVELEKRLAREDVSWNWENTAGALDFAIEAAAGLADLIVLSNDPSSEMPFEMSRLAGRVASKAGRPVLAVPSCSSGFDAAGTAIVAWDGSREADDALRSAVPLLKLAGEVILFDLDEPEGEIAAASAATYLSRHDIHPVIEIAGREDDEPIYKAILARAQRADAAYVVMGAYGHLPAVETVFGGVTRSMLANADRPLLLAH